MKLIWTTEHYTATRITSNLLNNTDLTVFIWLPSLKWVHPACFYLYRVKHRHTRDVSEPRHNVSLVNMGQGWQEGEKDEEFEPLVMPSQCDQLWRPLKPHTSSMLTALHAQQALGKNLGKIKIWQPVFFLLYMDAKWQMSNRQGWHLARHPHLLCLKIAGLECILSSPTPQGLHSYHVQSPESYLVPICFINSHWWLRLVEVSLPQLSPLSPVMGLSSAYFFRELNDEGQEMFYYHSVFIVLHGFNDC